MADGLKQARLQELIQTNPASGVCWSVESDDLDCNLVTWRGGEFVAEHVNAEVDVLFVILSGKGRLSVNGEWTDLVPGTVNLVIKNSVRSIAAGEEGIAYLSVHKRRKRLMPGDARSRSIDQLSLKKRS